MLAIYKVYWYRTDVEGEEMERRMSGGLQVLFFLPPENKIYSVKSFAFSSPNFCTDFTLQLTSLFCNAMFSSV